MAKRKALLFLALLALASTSRVNNKVKKPDGADAEEQDVYRETITVNIQVLGEDGKPNKVIGEDGKSKKETRPVDDDVTVFKNSAIAKGMMTPSKDFPKHMQYIVWMDQAGQYGKSTGAPQYGPQPDGLVVIAQEGQTIDANGWQKVNTCNKGWSWFFNEEGKAEYEKLRTVKGGCHYNVHWKDEARTTGQLFGFFGFDWLPPARERKVVNIGFQMMPWWNCKLNGLDCEKAKEVTCPPPEGKKHLRHHCAMWERFNRVLGVSVGTYYAFPVIDPDGKPVEPYHQEFLEAMKTHPRGTPDMEQFAGTFEDPEWDFGEPAESEE